MATKPATPTTPEITDSARGQSLRFWGALAFVMFILTSAVGGSLALESSYLPVTLASHIGLALVTLGIAGYATSVVGRRYKAVPRASAGIAALSALGATVAGTVFLVGGQSDASLYAMEGFAVIGIVAGIVMMALGGASGKRAPAETTH